MTAGDEDRTFLGGYGRQVEAAVHEVGYRVAWESMLENSRPFPDDPAMFVRAKARDAELRRKERGS